MNKEFKASRKTDKTVVVQKGVRAENFMSKLKGWIGKSRTAAGEGLLIEDCNNIHTWMMSVPIDVVFLKPYGIDPNTKDRIVLKIVTHLQPWKLFPVFCPDAKQTLELPAGTIDRLKLKPGEVLCIDS